MRVALYARVSTTRQAQTQTITQQLARLQAHAAEQGWTVADQHLYRDDGYSGAALSRPGLDGLRDRAAFGELDLVLITAPDRLARKYVHQGARRDLRHLAEPVLAIPRLVADGGTLDRRGDAEGPRRRGPRHAVLQPRWRPANTGCRRSPVC